MLGRGLILILILVHGDWGPRGEGISLTFCSFLCGRPDRSWRTFAGFLLLWRVWMVFAHRLGTLQLTP